MARDPEDIVDIEGVHMPGPPSAHSGLHSISGQPWKMVVFACCHAYGRIFRNHEKTQYVGRCPKCGCEVRARIGASGTSRTIFRAE